MKKGSKMTPEHKEKIRIGRERYLAERKAFPPKDSPDDKIIAPVRFVDKPNMSHRDYVVATIAQKKKKLIEAQLDVAIGYSYITESGKKIYTKPPNASTGEYLLNQLIGKPKESVDVKTEIRLNVDI